MNLSRIIPKNPKARKRLFELVAIVLITILLFALARLETRVYELSEDLATNKEFFKTLVYFGLINFNVVLLLTLCFLIFRNFAKLIVERQRGVFGSKLRSKLVFILAIFSIAPTILFFVISLQFITTAFDTWFSSKVTSAIKQTREAGQLVYERDRERVEILAKVAARSLKVNDGRGQDNTLISFSGNKSSVYAVLDEHGPPFVNTMVDTSSLEGFKDSYSLDSLGVYDRYGFRMWPQQRRNDASFEVNLFDALESQDTGIITVSSAVINDKDRDIVRAIIPMFKGDDFIGFVVAETWFGTQIIKSIEGVLAQFQALRPSAKYVRISYIVILILMSSLVLFISIWAGFYVARTITGPIQRLADATREVALGNYAINLNTRSDDETGTLVRSFNQMTHDLMTHRQKIEESNFFLAKTNEELDERRKYIEVILKNITAGVISVGADDVVTSLNMAAERLLGISGGVKSVGRPISEVLEPNVHKDLWLPVKEKLQEGVSFSGQIDVSGKGQLGLTLLAYGTKIFDESGQNLGAILVFDDATEQVKTQKVAAWKEVAKRIAHEIKNPITPIKINAQRLLRKYGHHFQGEDEVIFRTCLESILTQVDSLRDLVNEFSKFAQMPSVRTKKEDVKALLKEIIELYKLSYPKIGFDLNFEAEHVKVNLDKEQINRAFVNIMQNAIDAVKGAPQPKVLIKAEIDKSVHVLRLHFIDNGTGIPPQIKHKVLEPYFSTKPEGTGLGLAIVSQIVSDHGGYLRISTSEKEGTKIIIELPLR